MEAVYADSSKAYENQTSKNGECSGQDWLAKQLGMGNRVNVSRAVKEIEEAEGEPVMMWKKALSEMYGFTD